VNGLDTELYKYLGTKGKENQTKVQATKISHFVFHMNHQDALELHTKIPVAFACLFLCRVYNENR